MPGTELASYYSHKRESNVLQREKVDELIPSNYGILSSPNFGAASTLGGRWSFIFVGLIGVVVVAGVIFCCWKGRQQMTQHVTPVGDIELAAAL
ncbi:hypothetical protein F2Q69_00025070 [Brassica cretica]|uniref:Uncharacterized protein n=1 Tax=Brassica cretica TaxID=69181 RepID=A0A8S9QAI9_BRACR|nr:hypothetical protein F2Q69_00025070 [Brassica cretica]